MIFMGKAETCLWQDDFHREGRNMFIYGKVIFMGKVETCLWQDDFHGEGRNMFMVK